MYKRQVIERVIVIVNDWERLAAAYWRMAMEASYAGAYLQFRRHCRLRGLTAVVPWNEVSTDHSA